MTHWTCHQRYPLFQSKPNFSKPVALSYIICLTFAKYNDVTAQGRVHVLSSMRDYFGDPIYVLDWAIWGNRNVLQKKFTTAYHIIYSQSMVQKHTCPQATRKMILSI